MNLGTLRARVRRHIRDEAGDRHPNSEIDDYLNEAQLDLASRLRALQATATGATSGNTIALPSDYVDVETLRLGEDDIEWVDNETWNYYSDEGSDLPHTIGRVFGSNFELYPTPTTGTAYTLRYYKTPATLDTDDDVPAVMEHLQLKMIDYAIARCKLKDSELDESRTYQDRYEYDLPSGAAHRKHIPGPITLSFEPGPFDTVDAAHR